MDQMDSPAEGTTTDYGLTFSQQGYDTLVADYPQLPVNPKWAAAYEQLDITLPCCQVQHPVADESKNCGCGHHQAVYSLSKKLLDQNRSQAQVQVEINRWRAYLFPQETLRAENLSLFIAAGAGVLSFTSPCVVPLVPGYLGYLSSAAVRTDSTTGVTSSDRRIVVAHALAFVLGFTLVFTALGASVGLIGYVVRDFLPYLQKADGVVLAALGLHTMRVITRRSSLSLSPRPSPVRCSCCGVRGTRSRARTKSSRCCAHCGTTLNVACPNCGHPATPGDRFCAHCGGTLVAEVQAA